MEDFSLWLRIVVLLLKLDGKIRVLGRKTFVVNASLQIGHLHQRLFLAQQCAVEQCHQEDEDRDHRHGAANHDGRGGDPAALLLAFLFALLLLRLTALLGAADGLVVLPRLGVLVQADAVRGRPDGSRPGFGLHLFLRRGHAAGEVGEHPRRIVHHGVVIEDHVRVLPEFLHIVEHFRGGDVPVVDFQRHALHDDLLQPSGNIGVQGGGQRRAAVDMLDGHRHGGFPVVGRAAGHHFVHDNGQRIDIGTVVGMAALGLLRRDVMDASQCFLRQGVALAHDPGNAEVHHLDGAVFQHHDVMGLDVPVDDPPTVGVLQSFGDLHGKMQRLLPVEHPFFLHVLLEGNAVDQLHDDIIGAVGGGNVVDLHDVGMAQHGHGFALGTEPAAEFLIPCEFILEYFDGYQPVQPVVTRLIDDGHAAGTDDLQNFVPVVQEPSNILIHIQKLLLSRYSNGDQHAGDIVRRAPVFGDV